MAVELNAAFEAIKRITAMAPITGDYTACFWIRQTGTVGASYRTAYILTNGLPTLYEDGVWLGTGTVAASLYMEPFTLAGGPTPTDQINNINTNLYFHVAYVRAGNNQRLCINAQVFDEVVKDLSVVPVTELWLGTDTFGTATGFRYAYFREWTAALSAAELAAEMISMTAVRAANKFTDCPLTADLLDISGNGHHFTAVGAITFVADPPLQPAPTGTGIYPLAATSSRRLIRHIDLPSVTQFTVMGWFRPDDLTNNTSQFIELEHNPSSTFLNVTSTFPIPRELRLALTDGFTTIQDDGAISLVDAIWIHVALVKDGADYRLYLSTEDNTVDCVLECEILAAAIPLTAVTKLTVRLSAEQATIRVKVWEAALTVTEIRAERGSVPAVRSANLYSSAPLPGANNTADVSGLNHHWFPDGEIQNAVGPAMGGGVVTPPNAPSNARITDYNEFATATLGSAVLRWDDHATDETGFEVWVCVGTACTDFTLLTGAMAPNSTSVGIGVVPNETRRYKVRAKGAAGTFSDFTNIAEITGNPVGSVKFPSVAGVYYKASPGAVHSWGVTSAPLHKAACMVWVKPEAIGSATICMTDKEFTTLYQSQLTAVDALRWDYTEVIKSHVWFGLRNGKLQFEIHDGRLEGRGYSPVTPKSYGNDIFPGTVNAILNRNADIATFNGKQGGIPGKYYIAPHPYETSHVPGPTGMHTIEFWCDFPAETWDGNHGPDEQDLVLIGPELPVGIWSRVGFRWVTETFPFAMTVELLVDCVVVATNTAWVNKSASDFPWLDFYGGPGEGLSEFNHFVGGSPNLSPLLGATPTPITLSDYKLWSDEPEQFTHERLAEECNCVGHRPDLWWTLRKITDLVDYGFGMGLSSVHYDPIPVGTFGEAEYHPFNPCVAPPPLPPGGGPPPPPLPPALPPAPEVIPGLGVEVYPIRRLRQAPHLADEDHLIRYNRFCLDLMGGFGAATGQGTDPIVYLSWSDDGGHRWSNEYPLYAGVLGDYKWRAARRRLGSSRDRIFRVTMSDPIDWVLLDAFIDIAPGTT